MKRVEIIVDKAMKKCNIPLKLRDALIKDVEADYNESDIRKLTIRDVVEIFDCMDGGD